MIIELICSPLWLISYTLIGLLPSSWFSTGDTPSELFNMLYTAFQFFPSDVWALALGSITFWVTVHFSIALINVVLNLIPFFKVKVSGE